MIGAKTYELTNHLGNVLATISDKKIGNDSSGVVNYYVAEVLSQSDYYPFGMQQPARSFNTDSYRYGFNGYENENEIAGLGNMQDFGARIYDNRLGRWLSLDPLQKKYPNESHYNFVSGNPILYADKDGLDKVWYVKVIAKDGTVFTIATRRDVNNRVHLQAGNTYGGGTDFYATDVKQTLTFDMRTDTWSVSKEESDFAGKHRSIGKGLIMKWNSWGLGESDKRGKQKGGWVLTSKFTSIPDGPKTDSENAADHVNVDLIMAALSAVNKGINIGQKPNIKDLEVLDPTEFANTVKDFYESVKAVVEPLPKNSIKGRPKGHVYHDEELNVNLERHSDSTGGLTDKLPQDTLYKKNK